MKDKANLLFLANTALSTLCGLALLLAARAAPSGLLSKGTASLLPLAAMAAYMVGSGLLFRRREGKLGVAAALPAAGAVFGLCMAASTYADQPLFFAGGFVFAVAAAVFGLMKNVDELVSPKLLLLAPMAQIMVIYYVVN